LFTPPACNVPATWRPTRPDLHSSTDPTTAWVSPNILYNASNNERESYHPYNASSLLASKILLLHKERSSFLEGDQVFFGGGPGPDLRGIAWAGFSDAPPLKQASSHLQQGPSLGTRLADPNKLGQHPIMIADIYILLQNLRRCRHP